MEAPDEELMLAYRDGDAGAFDTLYRRHRGALYRYVLRGIKERSLAEELYQEIWMRVIEARERYQPRARFTTWLYTIAHNRMVDHWRSRGLSLVSLEEAPEAVDSSRDPARAAEARQSLRSLAAALEALPPAQREAFLLHEEAGLSVAEIAAATGSDEEAAKSRLRYAVAKLKAAVDHG
jgi:RNA polymerase sigma-70 factor (ECF subfamily)